MKKVRFVFYEARFEWRNLFNKKKIKLVDDGISLWTGLFNWGTPGYSHVEGWIAGQNGNFKIFCHDIDTESSFPKFVGMCYTSTMRGKHNGTVKRPASEVFTNPNRWFYLEFEVTDESFAEAKHYADERVRLNKGYSKKDIFRFFMPLWLLKKLKLDDPDREICSEHAEGWAVRLMELMPLVDGKMYTYALLDEILIRSPRRLWRDLVRRHHAPTYSLATGKMVRDGRGKKVKT